MNFLDISTLDIAIELDVLKRETQCYSLFLYQHKGVLFADHTRIGNNNQEEAHLKFVNLLVKARDENISLVVAPEYSCPKSIIDVIIEDQNLQPKENKIWALGGESLNKGELNELADLVNDDIYIHFEDGYNNSDKNYVDPLYYIFRGQHMGSEKLIILIQFKSNHMGGLWHSQIEPNNLIQGKNVYILKNNDHSVRLMSLICSQAMNFNAAFEKDLRDNHSWTDSPFLFLSLQFNPNPSHQRFIEFKNFALNREKRELITLNWGLETSFLNGIDLYRENKAPRSGIYFKTSDTDLDYKPKKIIHNHNKGFYFLHIKRSKRVYFLSRGIDLFKIENKSVDITEGVDEQQRREGPTVTNIYGLDRSTRFKEIENVEDNHIDLLTTRGVTNEYLLNHENSIVDKERFVNISIGEVKGEKENKWSEVIHLNSFILDESDECNKRLTYIEDTYRSSEEVRTRNCSKIFELEENILSDKRNYPHSIKHLANKRIRLAYSQNANTFNYKFNLVNSNAEIESATVCYIGNAVSPKFIKKSYDDLQKLFDNDSPGKNTIVVFYKRGNDVFNMSSPDAGSITKTPKDNSSIF